MINSKLKSIGVSVPNILFPSKKVDLNKWSVVACDQYTSERSYWETVEKYVGDNPSTLRIIFPEVYLGDTDSDQRIELINKTMMDYLGSSVLEDIGSCFIYVERKLSSGLTRKGLILAVDLEHYDYNKDSHSLIRATEETVVDRIPPRMKIRKEAAIELPHIMLLIDDPNKTVIEPLSKVCSYDTPLYDFELMMEGGRIIGYKIDKPEVIESVANALCRLSDPGLFQEKYNISSDVPLLLFAVGDGNHSLASAKAHWEQVKKTLPESEQECHPARFALVEVVNVHDDGLIFEPIHRVVFNVNATGLLDEMKKYFSEKGSIINITRCGSLKEAESCAEIKRENASENAQYIVFITNSQVGVIEILNAPHPLEVGSLQDFLDKSDLVSKGKIDYIHGNEATEKLSREKSNIGFILPVMHKNMFFKSIISKGVLPRKTFSMGEAWDKRFYLECRRIK